MHFILPSYCHHALHLFSLDACGRETPKYILSPPEIATHVPHKFVVFILEPFGHLVTYLLVMTMQPVISNSSTTKLSLLHLTLRFTLFEGFTSEYSS